MIYLSEDGVNRVKSLLHSLNIVGPEEFAHKSEVRQLISGLFSTEWPVFDRAYAALCAMRLTNMEDFSIDRYKVTSTITCPILHVVLSDELFSGPPFSDFLDAGPEGCAPNELAVANVANVIDLVSYCFNQQLCLSRIETGCVLLEFAYETSFLSKSSSESGPTLSANAEQSKHLIDASFIDKFPPWNIASHKYNFVYATL